MGNCVLKTWNKHSVSKLYLVVLSAELPFIEVICQGLTEEDHSASQVAARVKIDTRTINESMVSVLHGSCLISLDLEI